jgi:hypothetical protein
MMSEFTRCPHCGFTHTRRPDGLCPRCGGALGDSPPVVVVAAPAVKMAQPAGGPAAGPRKSPVRGALGDSPPVVVVTAPAVKMPRPAGGTAAGLRKRPVLGILASAGGAAIGMGASRVFGVALLIPMVVAPVVGVVLAKAGPVRARPFVPAVSVLVGHLAWIVAGALVEASFAQVAIDAVLMLGGAAWLLARPGLAPAVAIGLFEVLALVGNAWQLTLPQSTGNEKALVLHVLLRAAVIVGLVVGYVKVRAQERGLQHAALARTFE